MAVAKRNQLIVCLIFGASYKTFESPAINYEIKNQRKAAYNRIRHTVRKPPVYPSYT